MRSLLVCHADLVGGTGTVVTAFGVSMQDFGTRGKDSASLERALATDRDTDFDSDGDDIADSAELTFGSDPNDGPGRVDAVARPQHGCSVSALPGSPANAVACLGMAWAAMTALIRRRAKLAAGR